MTIKEAIESGVWLYDSRDNDYTKLLNLNKDVLDLYIYNQGKFFHTLRYKASFKMNVNKYFSDRRGLLELIVKNPSQRNVLKALFTKFYDTSKE
jgi:hypothetical protein